LIAHNKREVKAKWMILDAFKDHPIPHISEKKTTKEMFDALISLYQSQKINRKMMWRKKLRSIVMTRSDIVTSSLMKITQIHDQLATVGEKLEDVLSQDLYLCKAHHKIPKSCVTMEETTTVTLVGSSLVLVMEEVHHKGGFPGDLKGSNSKFSSQAYRPLS
jgi:hypothetical protein